MSKFFIYDVIENNIYQINAVEIWVNNLIAYKLDGLSLDFRSGKSLEWVDRQLYTNSQWIQLMQNDECNATE